MVDLIIPLMEEYQRLMKMNAQYKEWERQNPELYPWEYEGKTAPKEEIRRVGIMIRQAMVKYER